MPIKMRRIPDERILAEFGYGKGIEGLWNLVNWRMADGFGNGVLADLGAHQVDVLNWFMGTAPMSVSGTGTTFYSPARLKKDMKEWALENEDRIDEELYGSYLDFAPSYDFPDRVEVTYEYQTPAKQWKRKALPKESLVSTASYKVGTDPAVDASSMFFEKFAGEKGSLTLSENSRWTRVTAAPESEKAWTELEEGDDPPFAKNPEVDDEKRMHWRLPVDLNEPPHALHLRDFVETILKGGRQADLNCPAVEGFRTLVTLEKTAEAVATGEKIDITPTDFKI